MEGGKGHTATVRFSTKAGVVVEVAMVVTVVKGVNLHSDVYLEVEAGVVKWEPWRYTKEEEVGDEMSPRVAEVAEAPLGE